jgi:plastocyanin
MDVRTPRALFTRILIVLGLVAAGLPNLSQVRAFPEEEFGLPAAEIYVADGQYQSNLIPLDAVTLQDRSDRPSASGDSGYFAPVLSADGSTLAYLDSDATIVVRDGLYGPERLRFFPNGEVGYLFLNRDGSRLVAEVIADYSDANLRPPAWKVFDTADGRLLSAAQSEQTGDPWGLWVVDPDALRVYRLAYATSQATTTGPQATVLIANDLSTGAELGRLDLPEIHAGFWQSDETVEFSNGSSEPLMKELMPALAISPDGRRLAIAHADAEELTVFDAQRMAIERTVALTQSSSTVDRLLGLLPLRPESAAAKALEGTMLQAAFSPDGSSIYLAGTVSSVEENDVLYRGLGLRVVDVESGTITATAFGDDLIDRIVPSADGSSLYAAGPQTSGSMEYRLRHVDATSLEVIAERTFPEWRWFLMRSTMAEATAPLTIELVEMAFAPNIVTIPANTDVELTVVNHGTVRHNFRTGDEAGTWEVRIDLEPGESKTVTINAPAGEYKLFCDEAGHADAGMGGAIIAR